MHKRSIDYFFLLAYDLENHCGTYLRFLLLFFLLFVFLKQAFHSLEWCTLNKRQTRIRAVFQGPKFEISAQELEGMNMVF